MKEPKHFALDAQNSIRDRFLQQGAAGLTDCELLSLLIGGGSGKHSPEDLAQNLLERAHGSLVELSRMSPAQINQSSAVGATRAVVIAAALELGRRRQVEGVMHKEHIVGSVDIIALFEPLLRDLPHEEVWMLLLTGSKRIIERVQLSKGGTSSSAIDIRVIARAALERKAAGVVLVHNHPTGNSTPSSTDMEITRSVAQGLALLDIRLLDHIIIGDNNSFSFAEKSLI